VDLCVALMPNTTSTSTQHTPSQLSTGEEKAAFGWLKLWMLSIIAGCYIGIGFTICLIIGGNIGA